ncbi:hypothetical protein [Nocardia fluminea]|uniref:hypothetical protein n=1 Tax=Nocardia fluminea TaxID=134984 RepID=UPI003D11296E
MMAYPADMVQQHLLCAVQRVALRNWPMLTGVASPPLRSRWVCAFTKRKLDAFAPLVVTVRVARSKTVLTSDPQTGGRATPTIGSR